MGNFTQLDPWGLNSPAESTKWASAAKSRPPTPEGRVRGKEYEGSHGKRIGQGLLQFLSPAAQTNKHVVDVLRDPKRNNPLNDPEQMMLGPLAYMFGPML